MIKNLIMATLLLVVFQIEPVLSRTADTKPWHVLKPVTCCFDNNTGTAAFVASYATKQECLAGAFQLAKKLTPANCRAMYCAAEVWCINVDESSVIAPIQ